MMNDSLSPEWRARLDNITGKRARIVIQHILAHGTITTEDLKNYGYNHPPRAIRDVRDQGIPLDKFSVKDGEGRTIAAYRLGNLEQTPTDQSSGRKNFSKSFKQALLIDHGAHCAICNVQLAGRYLQIDHRVPYAISGESIDQQIADYMLLCASCNRAKAWSCEHCANMITKNADICRVCYWASPLSYEHIALRVMRRVNVAWTSDDELAIYQRLQSEAQSTAISIQDHIKTILENYVKNSE